MNRQAVILASAAFCLFGCAPTKLPPTYAAPPFGIEGRWSGEAQPKDLYLTLNSNTVLALDRADITLDIYSNGSITLEAYGKQVASSKGAHDQIKVKTFGTYAQDNGTLIVSLSKIEFGPNTTFIPPQATTFLSGRITLSPIDKLVIEPADAKGERIIFHRTMFEKPHFRKANPGLPGIH